MSSNVLCLHCSRLVANHHQAIDCDSCGGWQHRACNTGISRYMYAKMRRGEVTRDFICEKCAHNQTPMDTSDTSVGDMLLQIPPMEDSTQSLDGLTADTHSMRTEPETEDDSFNVTAPFTRPQELEESALAEPNPTSSFVEEAETTYEVVDGGSSKGKSVLLESTGFSYTQKRQRGNIVYWWCSQRTKTRRCPATVIQRDDNFRGGLHRHDHPADLGLRHKTLLTKKVKTDAKQQPFVSAKAVVEDAYKDLRAEDFNLPDEGLLVRRANRHRQKTRPPEPRREDFQLVEEALPDGYLCCDLTVDGARHIIFATNTQLDVLQKAKRWYVDGTFKVLRSRDTFEQLYSIHAFLKNDEGETKQVPLVFIFMSRKRKKDYKKVFKKVKALTTPNKVEGFVLDFEAAAWSAIRRVFPDVKISGCAYHWSRAVWRKVQNLGLTGAYMQDEGTHWFIRKILALPLIPAEHAAPAFEHIQRKGTPPLQPLLEYVQSTWFNGFWSPEEWSVYGQSIRTNNDCEGWHRRSQ
ncbi:uncharacterized protein LOC123565429 [Mercenaria mercenaria]|uniref:uncharacterized protein LOC123565429 n=1 Tax=Mercenaria mercenaria TaxID=6596 RepID=UPI00234F8DAE|nr:uncharacterized protein LOC123565429 [Mercenaria mercenaria]